jgi:hypothetical protein
MFRLSIPDTLCAALLGLATLPLVSGCGTSTRAYTPTAGSAREALDAALLAWQKGEKPDQLAAAAKPVHAVDFQWRAGQVLEGYEVLDEKPGDGDTTKRFAVVLKLKKPAGEKRVEYIVLGREPVWVFRDDDYAKAGDMGYDPRPARAARRP